MSWPRGSQAQARSLLRMRAARRWTRLDGRWKGTILWRLQDGPKRTSELKRCIPGITERMLIRHLQELVSDGILRRDDKRTIPPCVYYSLSSYGRTLGPVVQMMCNWGRSHLKRLSTKR
jgi:DNA-binding HxlR family transcriptional regulator